MSSNIEQSRAWCQQLSAEGELPRHFRESFQTSNGSDRGLGIGRRPNFATELTVHLGDAEPAELHNEVFQWVLRKLGNQEAGITLENFITGHTIDSAYLDTSLETRSFALHAAGPTPTHWAMRLIQRDLHFNPRFWETSVGISQVGEKDFKVKLLNEQMVSPDFHGAIHPTPLSTPGIVQRIISDTRWRVSSGSAPVSYLPQRIDGRNADTFLKAMSDPDRKLLAVAVAKIHGPAGDSAYPIDMRAMARSLGGVAVVYGLEDSRQIQDVLGYLPNHSLTSEDIPFQGFAQLYYPQRSADSEMRKFRISTNELVHQPFVGSDIHLSALRCSINGMAFQDNSPLSVATIQDIDLLENTRKSEENIKLINRQTKELRELSVEQRDSKRYEALLKQTNATLSELQAENMAQREELNRLRSANASLEEELNIYDSVTKQEKAELIAKHETELETTTRELVHHRNQFEIKAQEEQERVTVLLKILEPLKEQMNLLQILDYLEASYSENMVIHPDAYAGAEEMVEKGCLSKKGAQKRANQLLEAMATRLFEMKFEEGNFEPKRYKAETGFEVNMTESKETKARGELMNHRVVSYQGEPICAEAHVKFGNQPGNQIRVHFFFDERIGKVVIAKIADHLPIYSSNSAGKRR